MKGRIAMTTKELVMRAMRHESTPFPPFFVDFTPPLRKALETSLEYGQEFKSRSSFFSGYNYCGNNHFVDERGIYVDDFGVEWDRSGVDDELVTTHSPTIQNFDLSTFELPAFDADGFSKKLRIVRQYLRDRVFLAGIGYALFERAVSLCSLEQILLGMVANAGFVHSLMSQLCEYNLKVLDVVLDHNVDIVYFGDDWGSPNGLIMGKKNWNIFIKPYMAKMFQKVKKANKLITLHSCGNISECLPDLIKMGLDCYQSLSPDIYNLFEIKSKYGKNLCLWGGISPQLLMTATYAHSIEDDIDHKVKFMNTDGGFILGTPNSLTNAYPLTNIITLLRHLETYAHRDYLQT